MTTSNTQFENGTAVLFNGSEWIIAGYAKGWYELNAQDFATREIIIKKARAKDLELAEDAPKMNMSGKMAQYRPTYVPATSYSGRKSLNNGDTVAQFLEGMAPTDVLRIAEDLLGLKTGELAERYINMGAGHQRMNAGNLIRFAIKRGDLTAKDLH